MPKADYLSLTHDGLRMPSVDHLSNMGILNVILDRTLAGLPAGLPPDRTVVGIFTNFVRLTDKALREYDAARAELVGFLTAEQKAVSAYLRTIDHLENAVDASHRALSSAKALHTKGIGRRAPQATAIQSRDLKNVRDSIEHADEKTLGIMKFKKSRAFAAGEPFALRLSNTAIIIGPYVLSYLQLVRILTKMHRTVEIIRGVPTGTPGPSFPNAKLRTEVPARPSAPGTLRPTSYLTELSRLVASHA